MCTVHVHLKVSIIENLQVVPGCRVCVTRNIGGWVWQGCGFNFVIYQAKTLKVEYPIVHSNRERAVIFVVDANDGSLQSDAAATRTSLHLLLGLKHQNKKDIQISPAQLLTSLSLSLSLLPPVISLKIVL